MSAGACFGTDTLLDLIEGRATPAQRAAIEDHASRCDECRRVLSSLARQPSGEESTLAAPEPSRHVAPDALAPGDPIGRYVIRARLGAGGMGVVYAALDPDLGREVAIKLLSPRLGGSAARAMYEERLRREARALAQLAHPNVVAIHDVGQVGERMFIAMELLDGETLAQWSRDARRAPGEILERFREAGRGLAAAHVAGIVHRDVKPENMMLGKDGRVRVVDFGLACTPDEPGDVGGEPADPRDGSLTTPGAVLGTPHYMAPEQHRGEDVDARTDQFAFCVALYVALYDMRPFEGDDLAALARSVAAGAVREPPRRRGVPRRIWRALRRGMSPDRADRFATFDELLARIEPRRRAHWRPVVGLLAVGAVAAVLAARGQAPRPCADMEQHLAGVWDPVQRARLVAAIYATGAPFADAVAHTVVAQLDDYTSRWLAARVDTCSATRVRGEQTEAVMSLRMACIDARLQELGALVDTLTTVDRAGVGRAVAAASKLTELTTCADAEVLHLRSKPPRDPVLVAAVRAKLASARALEATGRVHDALAAVAAIGPDVTRAAYRPLEAELALLDGTLHNDNDTLQPAIAALERAVWAAEASGYDSVAAKALVELVHLHGTHAQFAEADAARARATAALERIGDAPALSADLDYAVGYVALVRGDFAGADAALTRALHTAEPLPGDDLRVASTLVALGQVALRRMSGTAGPYLERARVLDEKLLGPDHPDLAAVHVALGGFAYEHADYDTAAGHYERAIAILEHALGRKNAQVANALDNLAQTRQWQGRADDALVAVREAVEIDEQVLPKPDPDTAAHLATEAEVLEQLDRHDDALAVNDRALVMLRALYGAEHQDIADALHARALIELAAGHPEQALADARAAFAMFGHVDAAFPMAELHRTLGRIELAMHDPRAALVEFDEAQRHPRPDADVIDKAVLDGFYGRALVEAERDRARGIALVTSAYQRLHADGRAESEWRELERWMRAHAVPVPR